MPGDLSEAQASEPSASCRTAAHVCERVRRPGYNLAYPTQRSGLRTDPGMEETAPDMADSEPDDPMGLDQVDDLSTGSENEGVLEESDTLEGGPTGDPLDTGIIPADKWSAGEG